MPDSIIGLYRQDVQYNDWRVGTPDETKYHDISTVKLELNDTPLANRVGSNHGFGGLRGVIIPRATRMGGSKGHDHMIPKKVYIDPELTNRRLVVDPLKIQEHPGAMIDAIQKSYSEYPDASDAAIAAFAEFAEPLDGPEDTTVLQPQNVVPTPMANNDINRPSVQLPANTYVAPKHSMGGGQVKKAFVPPAAPGFGVTPIKAPAPDIQPSRIPRSDSTKRSMQAIRSLRGEFNDNHEATVGSNQQGGGAQPMRKVTFELPGMGQFPCYFHDVLDQDGNLILVYDHSYPAQHVWFPPNLEDQAHNPTAIAIMVEGTQETPAMLYLAYSTGVRFRHRSEEYCLLTIEKSKPLGVQQQETE